MKELHLKYKRDTGNPAPDFSREDKDYVEWLEEFAKKQMHFEKWMEDFNKKQKIKNETN